MTELFSVADLPEFDASHFLDSNQTVAAYLTDILQANDSTLLVAALGEVARARCIAEIARGAGLAKEAL